MDFHIFWQGVFSSGVAEDYLQNNFAKDLISEPLNKYINFHVWNQGGIQ